jgi:hypothetical protein
LEEEMKSIRFAMAAFMVASFIVLTAQSAGAVSSTYQATACHAVTPLVGGQALTTSGGSLKNSGTSAVTVVCPVPKTTSGLGVGNDAITSLAPAGSGSAACTLTVYLLDIYDTPPTTVMTAETIDVGAGTWPKPFVFSSSQTDYWDGPNGTSSWYYPELNCTLQPKTTFNTYTVVEAGSVQSGYRIVSSAACTPTATSGFGWEWCNQYTCSGGDIGAVIQPGGEKLQVTCPMPAGAGPYAFIALQPAICGCGGGGTCNSMGCEQQGVSGSYGTVLNTCGTFEAETAVFDLQSGTKSLVCFQQNNAMDGDTGVFSYVTSPHSPYGE